MPDNLNPRVVALIRLYGWSAGWFAIALGVIVLLGWTTRSEFLVSLHPGLAALAPVTAVCFILAGTCECLRRHRQTVISTAMAATLLALTIAILANYAVIGNNGLNRLLGNQIPGQRGLVVGQTSRATAVAFLLLAVVQIGLGQARYRLDNAVYLFAGAGTCLSAVALLGYAYGVEGLYATAFYHGTALHTAFGLFALFLASFLNKADAGWAAIIASFRPSGAVTRMQLALTIVLPSVSGFFVLKAIRAGLLAPSLAVALLVVIATIPMLVRILLDGKILDELDMRLRASIQREQDQNFNLEARVTERTGELQQAESALRQAQKMEAVGQLTGGLAHDFNNLLMGIMGSLERAQLRAAQGRFSELDRYILTAQGAARRAASLTHRLLAFSRRQTLDPKVINVNLLVNGMDDLIRRTMGSVVDVEVITAAGLWTILADPSQIESSLLNLAINARDAMPDGGKVVIETGNRWLDENAGRERDLPPGQYVSLCVSDNGTGMAPDIAARAFDPFFTTKPLGQGTGLGLSMIYGFARQSGGHVRIYSEVGKGTMVCLYLPRHAAEAEHETPVHPPANTVLGGGSETVLVVDDEPTVRMLIIDVLQDLGYAALEADDGASALKILRSDLQIDLLISDVGLPGGLNGRQLADAAREIRPRLTVLFITGFAENAVISHGHLDPGMHIMSKPLVMANFARKVRELVGGAPGA